MVTVSYADVASLMNLTVPTDITAIQIENIIDTAVDALNVWNASLPNMTGTAGSKTASYNSKQWGAIKLILRQIYYSFFKDLDVAQLQGLSVNTHDLLNNQACLNLIKECAEQLRSDIPVDLTLYDVRIG